MIALASSPRSDPLVACAVLSVAGSVLPLARRLLELDDERLSRLRIVYGSQFLLVSGKLEDLPWVDGVQYLGRDANAPRLLLPTTLGPSVPCSVFERAVARRCAQNKPALAPPWGVSLEPALIFSIGNAQPIVQADLETLLGAAPPSPSPSLP